MDLELLHPARVSRIRAVLIGIRHALARPPTIIYSTRELSLDSQDHECRFEDAFSIMRHRLFRDLP